MLSKPQVRSCSSFAHNYTPAPTSTEGQRSWPTSSISSPTILPPTLDHGLGTILLPNTLRVCRPFFNHCDQNCKPMFCYFLCTAFAMNINEKSSSEGFPARSLYNPAPMRTEKSEPGRRKALPEERLAWKAGPRLASGNLDLGRVLTIPDKEALCALTIYAKNVICTQHLLSFWKSATWVCAQQRVPM